MFTSSSCSSIWAWSPLPPLLAFESAADDEGTGEETGDATDPRERHTHMVHDII
jgi:hypothetical protein